MELSLKRIRILPNTGKDLGRINSLDVFHEANSAEIDPTFLFLGFKLFDNAPFDGFVEFLQFTNKKFSDGHSDQF